MLRMRTLLARARDQRTGRESPEALYAVQGDALLLGRE